MIGNFLEVTVSFYDEIDFSSTANVWVQQCGATKGRLCFNHTETDLYDGQSTSTKVYII